MTKNITELNQQADPEECIEKIKEFVKFCDNECNFVFFGRGKKGDMLLASGEMSYHHAIGLFEHGKMKIVEDLLRSKELHHATEMLEKLMAKFEQQEVIKSTKQ